MREGRIAQSNRGRWEGPPVEPTFSACPGSFEQGLQLAFPVSTAHSEGDTFPPVSQNERDMVTQTKT